MKKVLFICRGNVARSQMAEMLLKRIRPDLDVVSAGIDVRGSQGQTVGDVAHLAPHVIAVMDEEGLNIRENVRKQLDEKSCEDRDVIVVILMPGEMEIPDYLNTNPKVIRWHVLDPYEQDLEKTRELKDQIKALVEKTFK